MKAIKIIKPFQLEIAEIETPGIKWDTDVKVKITSGGICGSDIQIWNGTNSFAAYPRIIGHEFGGIVTEIGKYVANIKPGDKVAVDPVISCGSCYACKIGRHNVCENLEVMGVHRNGDFSEYVVVPESNIHKFHSSFDETMLSLVEPFSVGMQINMRVNIQQGDKVLIIGSGPIGIAAMQAAHLRGAEVMMTDIIEARLMKAKSAGADRIVLSSCGNMREQVNDFAEGYGIPVVIDTACTPSTFEQGIELASHAGRIAVIGLKNIPSQISMADITKKELTIVGSRLNCNQFDNVIKGFENGSLRPSQIVTQACHYTDVKEAIEKIVTNPADILKLVLKFNE